MNTQTFKLSPSIVICFLLSFSISQSFAQVNFVLIVTDDQGWTGSSLQMDPNIPESKSDFYYTPQIESLAQAGMTFSQAYAPAPKCSPTRCSILTGRTTARNQFTNTGNQIATEKLLIEPISNTSLNGVDTTLAEWLKSIDMDYRTAHFGKWHLGSNPSSSPSNNGFDFNDGSTNNNDGNNGGTEQADPKKIFDLTDRSIDFIQDAVSDNVPFFLQLSHYAVHADIEARPETIALYNDPMERPPGIIHTGVEYAAMTEDTDTGIGDLLTEISTLGIDDNTYVIFVSDNGGQINVTDNTPLFRGKTTIYEGGIRTPFIIKGPNIAANTYCSEPVIQYDLFPTIAALTGSTASLPSNLDGQSIVPLITGESFNRLVPLYFHSPHYENNPNKTPRSAVVSGDYKLIVEYETGNNYLFDLSTDIGESNDISGSMPDITRDLCIQLRDHLKTVNASMPTLDPSHPDFSGTAPDIDNDGLEDEWEFRELLAYTYGPNDDPDGDGMTNLEEFNDGTDPYLDESILALNENAFFGAEVILDSKVRLHWFSMENGIVDYLEIERSIDAIEWESIGDVDANISSFVDTNPIHGLAYYRLKVVNKLGEVDYSYIINISINKEATVQVFPNPASNILYLQFNNTSSLPQVLNLQILNNQGQTIKKIKSERASLLLLPIEDLPCGNYFIQVNLETDGSRSPIIQFSVI